ncbi:MAG: efflux RND transporter permease subunit [Acidobacteriota bacterium]
MTLYSLSIRRPVLAIVFSLGIVLFGALGFMQLGVREFPSVDSPVITVTTSYRGANADVVENQITEPLEEEINGIDGIRTLTSVSREGRSTITVEFDIEVDIERAANDVRDRVSRAQRSLPPDVDPPSVAKSNSASPPIFMLNIRSDQRDLLGLSRIADELFKERLQTIPGISQIDIWGDKSPAMRLWVDPQKLAAYRLSPLDVRRAVERENVELPAGRIEGSDVELPVRTMSRMNTPAEFENLIIKEVDGRIVRFADVGTAEIGPLNLRTVLKNFGEPMVALAVRPQPGANYVAIIDEVYERLEQIKREMPEDLETSIGFDTTTYIRSSITEVKQTVALAFTLVILIIFLFLRDWRTTIIPILAIPVALIGSFAIMQMAGFSLNVLTLLGIVLAIGLVVDDAIVVLENIYAKVEAGADPITAGVNGTREIFFAVIATTLALVAVLLPLFFLGGLVGRLFREFGATLAGAVIISSFVALTLTPMLSSRLLKQRAKHSWFYNVTEPFFRGLTATYRTLLGDFMAVRWLALPVLVGCFGLIAFLFRSLPAELAPLEDRGSVRILASGPEGATFGYMDRYIDEVIEVIEREVPETTTLISVTSPGFGASTAVNSGFLRIVFDDAETRDRSQQEIADRLTAEIGQLTGARTFVTQSPTISVGRQSGLPLQFVVQAPDLDRLKAILPEFVARAEETGKFTVTDVNLKFTKPELRVSIDRARARDLGISALDIAQTLQLAYSEQRLGFFLIDGKQFEIVTQVEPSARNETVDLSNLYVPTSSGEPVLLDKLVDLHEESSPPQLYRFDRYTSAIVSAGLAPGVSMAEGVETMRGVADDVLDDSFTTALTGQSRDFQESSNSLLWVFALALVLIYLVLAAQFESFRDPFVIMLTVPLALAGALFSLWYFGQTLNIFSQIGMIMLIGLVTKNGILIVEFANQKRIAGMDVHEAVRDAAAARFRPVLMTSLSTMLGILPIALALGAGAESRVPMGIAIIGGLLVGTFLTLFVVPAMYTFLTSKATASGVDPRVEEKVVEAERQRAA